jgi:hypothetical protein
VETDLSPEADITPLIVAIATTCEGDIGQPVVDLFSQTPRDQSARNIAEPKTRWRGEWCRSRILSREAT